MPRDMSGTGRYHPRTRYDPFAFYSCARLGDPDMLRRIMSVDCYYITQDEGGGAPVHFAVTYAQLDMVHHLLNNGAEVNQRDYTRGYTPLHRAAIVAHYPGGPEMYEYLLSRGADPSILTDDYDPYLDPGRKRPHELAEDFMRDRLLELEKRYAATPKAREPHKDIGDFWALYDYGPDVVASWDRDFVPAYPEAVRNEREAAAKAARKSQRRLRRLALARGEDFVDVATSPVCFLFPGQGSQAVGMLKEVQDLPAVRAMLDKAHAVLGYDLLDVCLNGPKAKLDATEHAQPALLVAALAAVEKLRAEDPRTVKHCAAVAGLSVGEYPALVFAGAMSFTDALRVVAARAAAMAEAAAAGEPHGMLSVTGLTDDVVERVAADARAQVGDGVVCEVTNRLFPQGRVISGHTRALEVAKQLADGQGALKTQMLAVAGAFHTSLMARASEAIAGALEGVAVEMPRIPVISNVTGRPFESAEEIRALLRRQVVQPVMWEDSVRYLLGERKTEMYELGPGKQVRAMVKRLDTTAWKGMKNVEV
ncbi:unnamed protein product [Pedinophyceae sp. YPF-701]|nr:unnamed protein product [Pedinophyceae sp. YPF-701]